MKGANDRRLMNILVLRYRFIGDTIMTVPFLRNLRHAHPDARIDLVIAPYSSDVLLGIPYVDNLIEYDPPTAHQDSSGRHRTLGSKIRFIKELRAGRYDKAYILKRSLSSALIAFLSGAKERIGFDTEHRGFLLTKRIAYRRDRHEIQNFLEILRADGVPVTSDHLEAWLSEDEVSFAAKFLAKEGCPVETPLIGIHPFSAITERAWPVERFVEVANALQKKHRARILLFGGQRDMEAASDMEKRIQPRPIMAAGRTDLRQTMALLSKCSLLICNDSGIMHLAAALDVALVALFGPQTPDLFGPSGKRCAVVSKRFHCSPCRQKFFKECAPSPSGKPWCMEKITAEEVLTAASGLFP